ncbi:Uncharacterised protein [Mycobacteroides abscessus subsp. abscessus]|nr:Uncharacterised protein [Mycobacteroides abscessus subsp. abscessus]
MTRRVTLGERSIAVEQWAYAHQRAVCKDADLRSLLLVSAYLPGDKPDHGGSGEHQDDGQRRQFRFHACTLPPSCSAITGRLPPRPGIRETPRKLASVWARPRMSTAEITVNPTHRSV